jgi:oligopeptide/dipeptide ABC transporter ATP-binding protein
MSSATSDPAVDTDLLQVSDLVTSYPIGQGVLRRGQVQAVAGVSFHIAAGESLGLVGESGCGKSTVARTIVGLVRPSAGSVTVAGQDVTRLDRRREAELRRTVQMVFQDPFSSLNRRMTVRELITEPWLAHPDVEPRDRWDERVEELLEMVGLSGAHADRRPGQFSGGQLQRIGIARALAVRPRLLIADEAVSALDVSVQAQILNLLGELRSELGLAMLFISHDLSVVRHVCDRIAVMYLGRIVETGSREQLFTRPTHPYTQALIGAAPELYPWRHPKPTRELDDGEIPSPSDPPSGCRFRTRCPKAAARCAAEEPQLELRGFDHPSACHFAADDGFTAAPTTAVDHRHAERNDP